MNLNPPGINVGIPKTGTVYIHHYLDNQEKRGHRNWTDLNFETGFFWYGKAEWYQYFFKFAFVRNPFDLLVSHYKWTKKMYWEELDIHDHELKQDIKFKDYIKAVSIRDWPYYPNRHNLFWQLWSTGSIGGQIIPNYIGRYEYLDIHLDEIAGILGVQYEAKEPVNTTIHSHYTDYYDEESKSLVEDAFGEELKCFGYNFDGITEPEVINYGQQF